MTPREYKLLLTRSQKFAMWMPLIMFTAIPFIFFFAFYSTRFPENRPDDLPRFLPFFPLVVFFGMGLFYAWTVLSLPHRISVTRDRQLVFKSRLRTRSVRVADVLSIEPRHLHIQAGLSGYLLKHRDGKVRFPGQFTDQYLLLHEMKQANPALELKGC